MILSCSWKSQIFYFSLKCTERIFHLPENRFSCFFFGFSFLERNAHKNSGAREENLREKTSCQQHPQHPYVTHSATNVTQTLSEENWINMMDKNSGKRKLQLLCLILTLSSVREWWRNLLLFYSSPLYSYLFIIFSFIVWIIAGKTKQSTHFLQHKILLCSYFLCTHLPFKFYTINHNTYKKAGRPFSLPFLSHALIINFYLPIGHERQQVECMDSLLSFGY